MTTDPTPTISRADAQSILNTIYCAIKEFEFLTPSMFSAMVHIAIMSYWRGRQYKLDSSSKAQEKVTLVNICVESLMDVAVNNNKYGWFLTWLEKISDVDDERQLTP